MTMFLFRCCAAVDGESVVGRTRPEALASTDEFIADVPKAAGSPFCGVSPSGAAMCTPVSAPKGAPTDEGGSTGRLTASTASPSQDHTDLDLVPMERQETRSHGGDSLSVVDIKRRPSGISGASDRGSRGELEPELEEAINPAGGLRSEGSVSLSSGDVQHKYTIREQLGEGCFGTVHEVHDRDSEEAYALKMVSARSLKDVKRFEMELDIARRLKHPNIIEMREAFVDGDSYHLVMEMCDGGDLYEAIVARSVRYGDDSGLVGFSSERVIAFAWQMLTGAAYLHQYHFVHRDIKPENYLLSDKTPAATVKLIDFGLARECPEGEVMTTRVGTPQYVAPEVVSNSSGGYVDTCDVWSIGVTLWFICTGTHPFVGNDVPATLHAVVHEDCNFSSPAWQRHRHPEELKRLVRDLLQKDPSQRPSSTTAVRDNRWLLDYSKPAVVTKKRPASCCRFA